MPITLNGFSNQRLQPAQYPEDARTDAAGFGPSQTLARGTVMAKADSDDKLYAYDGADTSDGLDVPVGILMYDIATDANGKVYLGDSATASHVNLPFSGSSIFICGTFDPDDLTGWDDDAATAFRAHTLPTGNYRIP